jgi:hypothetical protein
MMVSNGGFIPGYSLIPLTILRSAPNLPLKQQVLMFPRVLLATIRDNGLCPCPQCLMPMTKLDRMGRRWDVGFRLKSARQYLADKVQQARRIVYKLGKAVAGTGVDGILKPTSSVPVIVSDFPAV